jgi:outer membrane lipoprotein LolB
MTRYWPGLILLLSLAGCATVPVQAPEPGTVGSLEQHAAALAELTAWQMNGRAAISTSDQAGTVTMNWRQEGESYSVELRAPWGAGTVLLDGDPQGVMLRTSKGVQEFASAPRELLWRHTGFDLPIEALQYWLLGLPEPDSAAEFEVDERGLLTELRQHGWRIRYLNYGEFDGLALPIRLYLTGEAGGVRVAVQGWSLRK